MANTLSSIEAAVRVLARNTSISLTNTDGLEVANRCYLKVVRYPDTPWQELTQLDTSITTVSGTSQYQLPASPVFMDVLTVEVQNASDSNVYWPVEEARSSAEWSFQDRQANGQPVLYRWLRSGSASFIYLRPAPATTSLVIRLTGFVQPTPFAVGADTSVFVDRAVDEALTYLIAAEYASIMQQPGRAAELKAEAYELLDAITVRRGIKQARSGK